MNWVELADHIVYRHGENSYLIDQLDADACRDLHRQLHSYINADHQHTEET